MATRPHSQTALALASLAPAWLALAWLVSKAQWFWNKRPDLHFGWIVLLLSAFVIWDRWPRRPPEIFQFSLTGFLFALSGCAVLFLVQIYQAAYGMMAASLAVLAIGALLVVAGNVHMVFGMAGLRFFAFPFLFLLVALPLPSAIHTPIVGGLQAQIASLNVELLNLAGIPATKVGSLIHLPNGTLGVDEACSGIRSLQSTIMATLFIGFLSLRKFSSQAILFVCGLAWAFIGNLIRSLYLSVTANAQGIPSVHAVHDTAGWSILLFTASGVAFVAWGLTHLEKWGRQAEISASSEPFSESSNALKQP